MKRTWRWLGLLGFWGAMSGSACRSLEAEETAGLRIIFVYNADADLASRAQGIATRIFAPDRYDCRLCALTHDLSGERRQWSAFLDSLPYPKEFLHRDEWRQRHPDAPHPLPAIFLDDGIREPRALITSADFDVIRDMAGLQRLLGQRLGDVPQSSLSLRSPSTRAESEGTGPSRPRS